MKNLILICIGALIITACANYPRDYDAVIASEKFVVLCRRSFDLFSEHKFQSSITAVEQALVEYEKFPPELQQKLMIQQLLSSLLSIKPMAFDQLGMTDEALASADDYTRRFGLSSDTEIRENVMSNLKIKRTILRDNSKKESTLLPKEIFDPEQVRMAMSKGNASIKGRACSDNGDEIVVTLLPVTPYLMAWKNSGIVEDVTAALPPEVIKISLRKKLGESGYYNFTNIKPGKYFVQAMLDKCTSYATSSLVGYNSNGAEVYHSGSYADCPAIPIEKMIEITKDGEVQTINLFSSGLGLLCR